MKPTISSIDEAWIEKWTPCPEALKWYKDYLGKPPITILNRLIKAKKYDWANWFIVRVMEYKDYVSYAVFAAEQVIDIYEKKYPDNKRPREAIEAAKLCIKDPSDKNKEAARAAAGAAAWTAAGAAAWTARAEEAALKLKILEYGMKLLEG